MCTGDRCCLFLDPGQSWGVVMLHRDCDWHCWILVEQTVDNELGSGPFRYVFHLYLWRVYGAGVGCNAAFVEGEGEQG